MRRTGRVISVLACAAALVVTAQPVAGHAAPAPAPDPGQGAALIQTADGPKVFLAAAATTGCGSYCDGKDPDTFRVYTSSTAYRFCATDAQTIHTTTNAELRYSPWCRTAWARQTASVGWLTGVLVQSYNANGTLRKTYTDDATDGLWSLMANDANLTARACFYFYYDEVEYEQGNRHIQYCTARY